ncbi:MAG TPA: S53 family peptidase [Candidatus Dormibacteraeota bacterium]
MNKTCRLLLALVCALLTIALLPAAVQADQPAARPGGERDQQACAPVITHHTVRCFARVRTDDQARSARPAHRAAPAASTIGNGGAYDPAYLQSAYVTPSAAKGAGQTVAIVDAYDDPNAESDMGYYRSYFGLSACTTANGCFRKVNQSGGTTYPTGDSGWGQEISLDLDMASAICPNCHVLLVEASSNQFSDLATAVDEAVALGANAVSNSYGGSEYSSETVDESHYNHPGVAITVSSGDNGYGVEFPAASQFVTAVGGTTLNQATNTGTRNASEAVWSGAGSGCSAYEPKPGFQHDTGCAHRTVADVSAVADPNTGVWVYDTYAGTGWYIFGGTSVASPIVASVYALAQNGASGAQLNSYPYGQPSALNDVTSGSNGSCGSYLCNGAVGYDGPTGLGTPNGVAAFSAAAPAASLSFTTAAQTLTAGAASSSITVQTSGGDTTINLSTTSSHGSFSNATVATVNGQGSFTYTDTQAGSPTITASATGFASATQTEKVVAAQATQLTAISPTSATLAVGATKTFTASAADQFGNPADASATAWALSGVGSLSSAAGAQTTYSATAAGTATLTASLGNTLSASITVSAAPDFSLTVSPASATITGGGSAYYTVTVNPSNGFSGAVSMSVTCPSGATCSWSSNPVGAGGSTQLRVRVRNWTARGTYNLTITGTSGSLTHTQQVTLTLQ